LSTGEQKLPYLIINVNQTSHKDCRITGSNNRIIILISLLFQSQGRMKLMKEVAT